LLPKTTKKALMGFRNSGIRSDKYVVEWSVQLPSKDAHLDWISKMKEDDFGTFQHDFVLFLDLFLFLQLPTKGWPNVSLAPILLRDPISKNPCFLVSADRVSLTWKFPLVFLLFIPCDLKWDGRGFVWPLNPAGFFYFVEWQANNRIWAPLFQHVCTSGSAAGRLCAQQWARYRNQNKCVIECHHLHLQEDVAKGPVGVV
jgi:hypothetical protein